MIPEMAEKWKDYVSLKTLSAKTIIDFILIQYQEASTKNKKPRHTKFLSDLLLKIFSWSKCNEKLKKNVKNQIDQKIMNIRLLSNQRTKPARTYPPGKLLDLIQRQWDRPIRGEGHKAVIRKYSATMALICFLTGRRWVDVTRIRWDNLESLTTHLGTFYKFYIPASKTNIRGARIECITIKAFKSEFRMCPIQMLNHIRFWQGNPSKGFVFRCVHKHKKFVVDPIWEPWSGYRCNGHWVNKKKVECLGQVNGNVTIGALQRFATKIGWNTVPSKHTFRRLVTLLHKRQGYTKEQINEAMGWVPDSNMAVHYAAGQDSLLETAPANTFASELMEKRPFHKFKDIQFEL